MIASSARRTCEISSSFTRCPIPGYKTRVTAATRLRREESLGPKTTMRVGGAARLYAEPASVADLQALR